MSEFRIRRHDMEAHQLVLGSWSVLRLTVSVRGVSSATSGNTVGWLRYDIIITYQITLVNDEGLLSYSHLRSNFDPSTTVIFFGSTRTIGGSENYVLKY